MAGHSKFKNIMHRKGAQDKKRAKVFAKLTREIMVAAKIDDNLDMNPRLRLAVTTARAQNMPKDNIDRAIKKASGGDDGTIYEECRYEGYGPGGVAIIVEALTDNRNRAAAEIRTAFSKNGGNLGETGSVAFMFDRLGQLVFDKAIGDFDSVFETVVEAGADNLEEDDESYDITTSVDSFAAVRDDLIKKYQEPKEIGVVWKPHNTVSVNEDQAKTLLKLIDVLEDNDDVQKVYANFDISDEIMEKLV